MIGTIRSSARFSLASAIYLYLTACAGTSAKEDAGPDFCSALYGVINNASETKLKQSIVLFTEQPLEIACSYTEDDTAQKTYCQTATRIIGNHAAQGYPWNVYECLDKFGAEPDIQTSNAPTDIPNRAKIIFLSAQLNDQTRLELRFLPLEDSNPYWGRYILNISSNP